MQDLGNPIFVQSDDRCDDGFDSLSKRADASLKGIKNKAEYAEKACRNWMDVRAFGQVFAFRGGVSVGVRRGPVSIHQAVSLAPEDADVLKECLRTMFVNDASSARPEGSMEVVKLIRWQHSCKEGQYSAAKVYRSVHVRHYQEGEVPVVELDELPGLALR